MQMTSLSPKKVGKAILCRVLESQVVKLRKNNQFRVVAVAGSVGKTSTKLAIAQTLSTAGKVNYQEGNYNDRLTVPLVIFGQPLPHLFNVFAWVKIISKCRHLAKQTYDYDYVVVELGTDHPGQLAKFAYLEPELAVITAVSEEHMEYFHTLDNVADEELSVFEYAKQVLVNIDDVPEGYLKGRNFLGYGLHKPADYYLKQDHNMDLSGSDLTVELYDNQELSARSGVIGKQGAKIALAAAAVADLFGISSSDIKKGLGSIKPFAGRMQVLPGINGSTIIDDTYNASPKAVMAGLDVLYETKAPQKLAILGSMNELGEYTPEAHRLVGKYCRPEELSLVVTIGKLAEQYLAPAAKEAGCQVISAISPYEAGQITKDRLKNGALILSEGSQNGVFAEEALKSLLKNSADEHKLVRQSGYWMAVKAKQFGRH